MGVEGVEVLSLLMIGRGGVGAAAFAVSLPLLMIGGVGADSFIGLSFD